MGLYDRNYMKNGSDSAPLNGKQMLIALIVINAAAFLVIRPGSQMYDLLALTIPAGGKFNIAYIWQMFTAGFLHHGIGHIIFNMWGLYIFGTLVTPRISGIKMLILYLAGVVCGNLLFYLFNVGTDFPVRLVGASGAVCAVMAAAATVEPERRFMMIFMPFTPIKTTTLVICYTIMEILFELGRANSGIAHLAHLGGFFSGYLVMKIYFGKNLPWDPFRPRKRSTFRREEAPRYTQPVDHAEKNQRTDNGEKVSQRELDALLDKLSREGINSLSEYEISRLRRARKQMRGEE